MGVCGGEGAVVFPVSLIPLLFSFFTASFCIAPNGISSELKSSRLLLLYCFSLHCPQRCCVPDSTLDCTSLFAKEQPDLNWSNPTARSAIYASAIRFWLLKGIDGFRVDAANIYSKDPSFHDAEITDPGAETQPAQTHYVDGPHIHEWFREVRRKIEKEFGDRDVVLVGELDTSFEELVRYIGGRGGERELDMVLDMSVIKLGGNWVVPKHKVRRHTLPEFKAAWAKMQGYLEDRGDGRELWTTAFMENHDQARSIPRFGNEDPKWREKSGKVLAMLLATLSGTLFLYQGQEIGMMNVPQDWGVDDFKDMDALMYLRDIRQKYPGDDGMMQQAMDALRHLGRDNARTPMQWVCFV